MSKIVPAPKNDFPRAKNPICYQDVGNISKISIN